MLVMLTVSQNQLINVNYSCNYPSKRLDLSGDQFMRLSRSDSTAADLPAGLR